TVSRKPSSGRSPDRHEHLQSNAGNSTEGAAMSKTAVVLIAEGTEEIEAITPGDVLNRCGVDVTYAGVGGIDFVGGHHVPLRADCPIEELGEMLFDALV